MSYFPCDIPFMSDEELKENGINIPKDVSSTNIENAGFISIQEALDAVEESRRLNHHKGAKEACAHEYEHRHFLKILMDIQPADVAPVVHAYWIRQKENHEFKEVWMKCSACGYPVSRWTGNTNFCPNCGAKMDGEEEKCGGGTND